MGKTVKIDGRVTRGTTSAAKCPGGQGAGHPGEIMVTAVTGQKTQNACFVANRGQNPGPANMASTLVLGAKSRCNVEVAKKVGHPERSFIAAGIADPSSGCTRAKKVRFLASTDFPTFGKSAEYTETTTALPGILNQGKARILNHLGIMANNPKARPSRNYRLPHDWPDGYSSPLDGNPEARLDGNRVLPGILTQGKAGILAHPAILRNNSKATLRNNPKANRARNYDPPHEQNCDPLLIMGHNPEARLDHNSVIRLALRVLQESSARAVRALSKNLRRAVRSE